MNYYIVRAVWDNTNDKSLEFIQKGYWINGYSNKFIEIVNRVTIDDYIVLAGKNNKVLNIGKCTKNMHNGKEIIVNWNNSFKSFSINNLGKYQKTIQKVLNNDFILELKKHIIFGESIMKEKFKKWLKENGHTPATLSTYPLMLSRDIPEILKRLDKNFPDSVFEINNLEILVSLYNRCLKGDLKEFNQNTQNRAPSAAINKYIEFLESEFGDIRNSKNNNRIKIKNIILYGAPGVGKTHNYQKLITMIENGYSAKEIFNAITINEKSELNADEFQKIQDDKRVEFVTFHQSYSYEDFIEGFRPQEDNQIKLEDGIFKKLSNDAINQSKQVISNTITFDDAFDILRTQYIESELDSLQTVRGHNIVINDFQDKFLVVKSQDAKNWQYVKKSDLETVVNGISTDKVTKPADVKKLNVKKDTISLSGYYFPIANKVIEIINNNEIEQEEQKNFYIVIDEINRGNISKIFGELITLIEESKRDNYEVTLPYSKEKFKVPSNLYIIATMNSTDKSIATIDIALRRRFTFLKMLPNLEIVKQTSCNEAYQAMKKLNEYIVDKEKGNLEEDHQLGHSYFMNLNDKDELNFILEYKIKPLLEEYFYADEKSADEIISEVLNNSKTGYINE